MADASLTQPVDLPAQSVPARGGLLEAALPAPDGWERGIGVPFYGCGEPLLKDKCVTSDDSEGTRPEIVEFPSFPIEQRSACSTLSRLDHEAFATGRLNATSEWAIARQLALDPLELGSPTLEDAQSLGSIASVVDAIACLEEEAALTGFGARYFLHTSPRTAATLRAEDMIDGDGRSPSGARWIISPGYAGIAPGRVWLTGAVWVGTSSPETLSGVVHRLNDDLAVASRTGLVAFDPCLLLSVDIETGTCPTPGS